MLTACGGGEDSPSEQPSPTPQPAENKAPTVSIQGVAEAKEQKAFELIANASDSDGSIASYTWSHDSDLEIAFSNKTAATTEITVPDISEDKSITFTMTVEDDKGASASESVTVTVKRKVSSVTITGIVTDKPIANAIVDVSAAQASEQVTADANGGYSATLVVDESEVDALVRISAKGVGAQEKVTFVSQLNSVAKLVEQAGDDGILSKEENFAVNVTNVTTAEYALLTRNNTSFTNDEELSAALLNVDANEKIELATLIKIVVDNDDFELPEGVESTLDLIDDEQTANEFTELVNETNPTLLEETKEEIKKNTDLVDGAKGELTGSYILQSVKYYDAPAYHIDINDNGAAQITAYDTQAAQWQYEGNVLTITPTEPLTLFKGNSADKGAVTITATSLALNVLGENDVFRTVDIVEARTSTYEDGTVENTEYKATSNLLDKAKTITLSEADLLGDWVLELIDRDNSNGHEPAEKLRFSAGGKLESLEEGDNNEELSWRLADNVLVVNYKDTKEDGSIEEGEASFWFTKSLASGYQFVLKDTSDPRWSDTEYGVLLKIDTNLQVSESDLIGRWTGFIGLQQDLYTMDLFESGELYLDAYDLEHAWFLDGNVMHRQRFIQNDYTVVSKCDVTESNCYLYEDVRHEILAIENGYIALEREYIRFNNLGEITFSDSSAFVYQYSAEIAQTKLQASMLRTNMEFYIQDEETETWNSISIEYYDPAEYDEEQTSYIHLIGESYEVTFEDGKLKYTTSDGVKVLELIEYGVSGWVVCMRDENAQCDESNKLTLHFDAPQVTITVESNEGGNLTPESTTVPFGSYVELFANPAPNYGIANVEGCNGYLSGDIFVIPSATESCKVTATFEPYLNFTATASIGGSVTPSDIWAPAGSYVEFMVTPELGYMIDSISGCEEGELLEGGIFAINNPTMACDLNVQFKKVLTSSFVVYSDEFATRPAYHFELNEAGDAGFVSMVNRVAISSVNPLNEFETEYVLSEPLIISQSQRQKRDENGDYVYDDMGNPVYESLETSTEVVYVSIISDTSDLIDASLNYSARVHVDGVEDSSLAYQNTLAQNLVHKQTVSLPSESELIGTWVFDFNDNALAQDIDLVETFSLSASGVMTREEDEYNQGQNITFSWSFDTERNALAIKREGDINDTTYLWPVKNLEAGYQFVAQVESVEPSTAKAKWGRMFKQQAGLNVTEDQVIGRWHGWLGFQQDRFDMWVIPDEGLGLDVRFGLNGDSGYDGRVENGVFYRELYYSDESGSSVKVKWCDVNLDTCWKGPRMTHKFVAIVGNKYFIHRRVENGDWRNNELRVSNDNLFIYEYYPETSYSAFTTGMFSWGAEEFFVKNADGNLSTIVIQYETVYEEVGSSFVNQITIDGLSYDLTIADGKLFYNDGNQDMVVEMLDNTGAEFVVCIYEASLSCAEGTQVTWHFEQPAIDSFYLTDTSLYTSDVYHFEFNAGGTANVLMTPYEQGSQAIAATWTSSDVLTLTPQTRTVTNSWMTSDESGNSVQRETILAGWEVASEGDFATVKVTYHTEDDGVFVSEEVFESRLNKLKLGEMLVDTSTQDWTGDWVLSNFDGEYGNNYAGHLTLNENFTGTAEVTGSSEVEQFNWAVSNGSLELDFGDDIKVAVELNRDINTGYQYTQFVTEGTNTVSVNGGLMIKKQSITMTEQDYYGRWGYFDGAEHTDYSFAMEIYDDLTIRFGLTSSSWQGRFVDGQFVRSVYYDTSTQEYFRFCTPEQVDCILHGEFRYTPIATDGSKVFFLRDIYNGDGAQGAVYTSSHIFVKEKMPSMEIAKIEDFHLNSFSMKDESDIGWSTWNTDADGNRLLTINGQDYPFIFNNGVIEVTLDDGFMYLIELVAGSNTKDGVTLCKYLQGDTCLEENHVRLSYYQTH